jgi:hypothetical protein
MILKDPPFFLLFDSNKFAEGIVSPIRIVYTLDQNFAELFGLILVGPVSGTFCLGQREKVKKKKRRKRKKRKSIPSITLGSKKVAFTTLPLSISLVVMTMTRLFSCQTMCQKSLTVLGRQPCVAM